VLARRAWMLSGCLLLSQATTTKQDDNPGLFHFAPRRGRGLCAGKPTLEEYGAGATDSVIRDMVRTVSTVSLLQKSTKVTIMRMETSGKRTVQVNVKMSADDFAILRKAADSLWPDAIVSNSGIILGLAKLAAKDILKRKSATRR